MSVRLARWRRYWMQRGVIPRWQQFGAYTLIVAAGVIGFNSIGNAADKSTNAATQAKHAALQAKHAARDASSAIREIQHQRRHLCKDQNNRHDKTIRTLNEILAQYVKDHPDQAKQVRDSVRSNVLLINALAPKRHCGAITTTP